MSNPYPFDPTFERVVVSLLVTSDRFYNYVGVHLDPARLNDSKAQELAAAARQIYETTGKAPGSLPVVIQRMRAKYDAGKMTLAKLSACADYINDAIDEGLPAPEPVISEVATIIQRLENQTVLDEALVAYAERRDLTEVAAKIENIASIGRNDASYGATLDGFGEELDTLGKVERMSTSFRELDVATGGGVARGEFVFWLAGQKVGKTMALVGNAVTGLFNGRHVAVATLEVGAVPWRARILGTVTATPYQDILKYGSKSVAFERYRELLADPDYNLGRLAVHKFAGHQTKLTEILDWVRREEDRAGKQVEVLVIDYADKLVGPNERDAMYEQMRDVYEGIRLYAEAERIWAWSASQAQRIELGQMPTPNNCADSQHKVRVTDGMIGITRNPDEGNQVLAKILAWRNGPGESSTAGPLDNGFDYGCFVKNSALGVEVDEALRKGDDGPLGIFA